VDLYFIEFFKANNSSICDFVGFYIFILEGDAHYMHIFIVYTHPSADSFTNEVLSAFIKGIESYDHTYEISDLYEMNFKTDISEQEYLREAYYRTDLPVETDVVEEQEKINKADIIVFIYPVFWTEAPAKLVGWFDRVWTYGFAYGERTMKTLQKALLLCITGRSIEELIKTGQAESMKTTMLGDRIFDRALDKEMIFLDGVSRFNMKNRKEKGENHLERVYNIGMNIGSDIS
jgi:NAD(P)H dehydrogenase (quinone)